jgi:hypothetical protein
LDESGCERVAQRCGDDFSKVLAYVKTNVQARPEPLFGERGFYRVSPASAESGQSEQFLHMEHGTLEQGVLADGEEYVEPESSPTPGCIPVSIEVDSRNITGDSDEFDNWIENNGFKVASIHMLSLGWLALGDKILMHSGSSAVFDLGPRRLLRCEGVVLGVARTDKYEHGAHHDILTVDVLSDIDHGYDTFNLLRSPLTLDPGWHSGMWVKACIGDGFFWIINRWFRKHVASVKLALDGIFRCGQMCPG